MLRERARFGHVSVRRGDDRPDGQVERAGKGVVPLVVGRNGHDGAGAVLHQHVVGDPDRQLLAADRIRHVEAGWNTGLLDRRRPLFATLGRRRACVIEHLAAVRRARGQLFDQRMLGRDHEERGPEERVRAGREDGDVDPELVDAEGDLGAVGAADPVALHGHDPFRPVELGERVDQLVRVRRRLEEPLLHHPRLDLGTAVLAVAVADLLVREHDLVLAGTT